MKYSENQVISKIGRGSVITYGTSVSWNEELLPIRVRIFMPDKLKLRIPLKLPEGKRFGLQVDYRDPHNPARFEDSNSINPKWPQQNEVKYFETVSALISYLKSKQLDGDKFV